MRSDVANDWGWADKHLDAIVAVLKQNAMHLLSVHIAPEKSDLKEATDLVITVDGGDVAVRIRRPRYNDRYKDLTIRAWRRGNIKTEIDKIRDGFARWYLYAWSDGNNGLMDWMLIDIDALRESGLLDRKQIIKNKDGRTGFIAVSEGELRLNNCLIARC